MTQLPLTLEAVAPNGQYGDGCPSDSTEGKSSARERNLGKPCKCGCGVLLTGRQESFASKLCNTRWWDAQHPRINRTPEGPREGSILDAVLTLLADGNWHTAHEIAEAVRAFPHSVSARLSELRKRGHQIEADASNGNSKRAHKFRLRVSA